MRLLVGDRGRPHSRQFEKFTDVLLGLRDAPAGKRALRLVPHNNLCHRGRSLLFGCSKF